MGIGTSDIDLSSIVLAIEVVHEPQAQSSPDQYQLGTIKTSTDRAPALILNKPDLIAAARNAAQHDHNALSASLFGKALGGQPTEDIAADLGLVREYADQLTYSGQSAKAIVQYRAVLAKTDLDPQQRLLARKGLALALSWNGQLRPALEAYDALIADQPDDLAFKLDRARVLVWLERHEEAKAQYQQVLGRDPTNTLAGQGLVQTDNYLGQQRRALAALDHLSSLNHDSDEVLFLKAQTMTWLGRPDRANPCAGGPLATKPRLSGCSYPRA
jgi:tetratricopeptide (TPR) repeat protein